MTETESDEWDSDSDSDSSSSSDDGAAKGGRGASKYLAGGGSDSDSDEDDDGARVVLSAKEKVQQGASAGHFLPPIDAYCDVLCISPRHGMGSGANAIAAAPGNAFARLRPFRPGGQACSPPYLLSRPPSAELGQVEEDLMNSAKSENWTDTMEHFEKLIKVALRAARAIGGTPKLLIKGISDLEDLVSKALANKEKKVSRVGSRRPPRRPRGRNEEPPARPLPASPCPRLPPLQLNATQAKALNALRQRVRKQASAYLAEIEEYRKDPEAFLEEAEEDEDDKAQRKQGAASADARDPIFTMDPKEITFALVNEKLREVKASRGKRGVSKQDQWQLVSLLQRNAKGPAQRVAVLLHMLSLLFDFTPALSSHMPGPLWRKSVAYLATLLDVLEANASVRVDEAAESFEERTAEPTGTEHVRVPGNLMALVERLDDEIFRSLQHTDPHTNDYIERLRDEPVLLALAARVSNYLSVTRNIPAQVGVAACVLEEVATAILLFLRSLGFSRKTAWHSLVLRGATGVGRGLVVGPDEDSFVPLAV